jgi:hypothetical protein
MPNKIFAGPAETMQSALTVEALAAAAFTPGHLVSRDAEGEFVVGDGSGETLVALEYGAHVGDQGSIDTEYSAGDLAIAGAPRSGEFYWIRAAAGTYAAGDQLERGALGRVTALDEGNAEFVVEIGATASAGDLLLCRKI